MSVVQAMYFNTNFLHSTLLFFYNHTEDPILSADEGKSQLRQQEEVPSEVEENQAQKNRKLHLLPCTLLTASFAPLEHHPLSSVMCSEFRNVCGFHQNQKCDKSNESYQAKLFDVMLFVIQNQMVLSFVSVVEILK